MGRCLRNLPAEGSWSHALFVTHVASTSVLGTPVCGLFHGPALGGDTGGGGRAESLLSSGPLAPLLCGGFRGPAWTTPATSCCSGCDAVVRLRVCGSGFAGHRQALQLVPGLRPAVVASGDHLASVTVLGPVWWGGDLGGLARCCVPPPPLSFMLGLGRPSASASSCSSLENRTLLTQRSILPVSARCLFQPRPWDCCEWTALGQPACHLRFCLSAPGTWPHSPLPTFGNDTLSALHPAWTPGCCRPLLPPYLLSVSRALPWSLQHRCYVVKTSSAPTLAFSRAFFAAASQGLSLREALSTMPAALATKLARQVPVGPGRCLCAFSASVALPGLPRVPVTAPAGFCRWSGRLVAAVPQMLLGDRTSRLALFTQ